MADDRNDEIRPSRVVDESPDASESGDAHGISMPEICREGGDEAEFVHPADMADHLENLSLCILFPTFPIFHSAFQCILLNILLYISSLLFFLF